MTTTTSATASATTSATNALLTSLGTGSGVDTASLVTSLVQAQFAARTAALTAKNDALTAQISAAGTLKGTIANFSTALSTLVKGGTLATQPVSSNAAAIAATALPGAKLKNLSTSISVGQLAAPQTAVTKATVGRTDPLGKGSFTLAIGTAKMATAQDADGNDYTYLDSVTTKDGSAGVEIKFANGGTIDDLAAAINAKKTGVTATVITDAGGAAYLSLKGQSGKDQAFTLTASGDDQAALAKFDVGGPDAGTRLVSAAQNAKLVVDGASVERSSNTISDLVTGVKLQLGAVTASPVSLTSTTPTAALSQAVSDFVATYNEVATAVKEQTDPKTGALAQDSAAGTLLRSLKALTTTKVVLGAADGTPTTLAAIGVRTNRDGTIEVDTAALNKALTDTPDAVEAIFAPSNGGLGGISAALDKVSTTATSVIFGLGASISRYTAKQSDVAKQQSDLTDQSAAMTTRLTQQYASLNSKISAYKSTQTFLDNQIKAWNKSDS